MSDLFLDLGLSATTFDCGGWWSMTTLGDGDGQAAQAGPQGTAGSPASGPALNSSQSTVKFNPKFILQLNSIPNLCTASPSAPLKGKLNHSANYPNPLRLPQISTRPMKAAVARMGVGGQGGILSLMQGTIFLGCSTTLRFSNNAESWKAKV